MMMCLVNKPHIALCFGSAYLLRGDNFLPGFSTAFERQTNSITVMYMNNAFRHPCHSLCMTIYLQKNYASRFLSGG